MRSAKLLIVAYKAHKRGAKDIASEIFAEAMEDETSPQLMEELFNMEDTTTSQEDDNDDDLDISQDDNDDDLDISQDDNDDDLDEEPVLSKASIKKLRGIANRIAAEDGGAHRDIAKKLLKTIRTFEKK